MHQRWHWEITAVIACAKVLRVSIAKANRTKRINLYVVCGRELSSNLGHRRHG